MHSPALKFQAASVRFRILGLLFVLSFVNYLLRNNLSVAQPSIMEEFHFSNTEFGWILFGFNIAYSTFQIPGGVFGELAGARRALTIIAVAWAVLTFFTGLGPGLVGASAGAALWALFVVRFLMGIANAPMFTVAAGAFANWFPVANWAFPNSVLSTGLTLGQATCGPLVSVLILHFGWRVSFYALAPLGLAAALWWWWYSRDTPREHRSVTPAEIVLIETGRPPLDSQATAPGAWRKVLVNRDVLLLATSYFCMNYVFYMFSQWLFTYLVKERGFTMLESGWLYALPFIVGAVLATVGGLTCDYLCRRIGPRWGCRLPGIVGMLLVAVLLLAGARSPHAYVAVILLSLCFGFTQFTEGSYWQGATFTAGPHTATASGVLNTGGNLAGLLGPLVGYIIDNFGWMPALATGSAFAVLGALIWLLVGVVPSPETRKSAAA